MTAIEGLRAVELVITGICMALFGVSMIVQARTKWPAPRYRLRNWPWGAVAGSLTTSIGIAYLVAAFRLTPLTGAVLDSKVALVFSTATAVFAFWTARRWFSSERQKR